jgi:hypothetical protein
MAAPCSSESLKLLNARLGTPVLPEFVLLPAADSPEGAKQASPAGSMVRPGIHIKAGRFL